MSHNFTMENMNEFSNTTDIMKSYIIEFPKKLGIIKSRKEIITDDICLFKTASMVEDTVFLQANTNSTNIVINIMLDGEVLYKDNILNKNEIYKKHNCYLKYVSNYDTTIVLNNQGFKSINITIKDSFIEDNFLGILENYSKDFRSLSSITLKNQISKNINIANDLYNSPFEGQLHNIYVQSKVLELIYNEFNEIMTQRIYNDDKKVKLNQDDIEALYKAKDIILTSQEFPDLVTLSKKVALNQFKLKYGFRQFFNTSPGNMILEQKMIYAKQLLETSEFSISEISNFVGYKYQSNFTNAFIKFFGVLPKDIMIQRKYYY